MTGPGGAFLAPFRSAKPQQHPRGYSRFTLMLSDRHSYSGAPHLIAASADWIYRERLAIISMVVVKGRLAAVNANERLWVRQNPFSLRLDDGGTTPLATQLHNKPAHPAVRRRAMMRLRGAIHALIALLRGAHSAAPRYLRPSGGFEKRE